MGYVNGWRYSGSQVNVGNYNFKVVCILNVDPAQSNETTCVGMVRFGYICNGYMSSYGTLTTPWTTINNVEITDHQDGWYYSSTDHTFSQPWGTTVNCNCSLQYTGGSGAVYKSTLSLNAKLMHPVPSSFDELNLTVNGVKLTKNLQVFTVDNLNSPIAIAFNVNKYMGGAAPSSILYIVSARDPTVPKMQDVGYTVSVKPIDAMSGAGPAQERVTVNTSPKAIFDIIRTKCPGTNDASAELNASKQGQLLLEKGKRWRLLAANGLPEMQLANQFIDAGLYRAGYIPFTLYQKSTWGNASSGYSYVATSQYFGNGPSFVIAYGPFAKYKDKNGVVHSVKPCYTRGPSVSMPNVIPPIEYNQGGYKDKNGTVRQLKNQGR